MLKGTGKFFRFSGVNKVTRSSQYFRNIADMGGDHWYCHRHGIKQFCRDLPLGIRRVSLRNNQDVCGREMFGKLVKGNFGKHHYFILIGKGFIPLRIERGLGPNKDQPNVRIIQAIKCLDQIVNAFVGSWGTQKHDHPIFFQAK